MRSYRAGELLLAETATSPGSTSERAQALLEVLRRVVPFDGAWLALADPLGRGYHSLASVDVDVPTVEHLSGALMSRKVGCVHPTSAPPELPHPPEELPSTPFAFHEALALALFAPSGRHVGFLALLSGSRQPSPSATRRRLRRLAPVLARGIDPMRSLLGTAHLVRGATAGAVLRADGGCQPLPSLPAHPLLDPGSSVLAVARERIDDGHLHSSFLWPRGGPHAPDGHVRVTVLSAPEDVPPGLTGLALLSPATDLRGLTPREIEVLGLLVEGRSNQEIARTLVVAPRTVASHVEHVLGKLGASTRTLAAVRAEREGLYVPHRERRCG
ncbi:response regulator transcription factor [Pseudonocardia broussonetiae]|uniref:Helix-turn-helix transcriptional regulator n=1 Tax=Pseudonocardia broussonetiae TaxID=2736640 RepID=A0A6M6JB81_9PSEU|nr:helix-turn-helix transcriptional regulator [Pseudonocardia broussonetiae]QJY44796.1 helix-turn-helix transcriptional regulator [Pseudonocardia broussonetiae]